MTSKDQILNTAKNGMKKKYLAFRPAAASIEDGSGRGSSADLAEEEAAAFISLGFLSSAHHIFTKKRYVMGMGRLQTNPVGQ